MHLDIYSDTICPWCYIGKKRLDRALTEQAPADMSITWRAFQLNPDMPPEGMERQHYLALKFGGAENAQQVYNRVRAAGDEEQIPFAFEAIQRTPNTLQSHRLIRFATDQGRADAVVNALFEVYFLRGENIGDTEILVQAATAAGLDPEATRTFLESDQRADDIRAEDAHARYIGIQGVPTFILDNKYVLSGAHPPEVLLKFLDISRYGEAEAQPV